MSANSSVFHNLSLHPQLSPNFSLHQVPCLESRTSFYTLSALSVAHILLLPVFFLVLYLGFQRWRRRRSVSTYATSHSDVITFHSIVLQLHEFVGLMLFYSSLNNNNNNQIMFQIGLRFMQIPYVGKAMFHLLTCLERYLAVVHPITYMALKKPWGVRIRNIIIGCVWLLSFGWLALLSNIRTDFYIRLNICISVSFICVLSFLSVVILCTLKRPGPGKAQVGKSKQRAFNTIVAIMGVLLMRFGSILTVFGIMEKYSSEEFCVVGLALCFEIPSTLVLPLLFLQRAGKLQCCK